MLMIEDALGADGESRVLSDLDRIEGPSRYPSVLLVSDR
jgi:hypothetical protein